MQSCLMEDYNSTAELLMPLYSDASVRKCSANFHSSSYMSQLCKMLHTGILEPRLVVRYVGNEVLESLECDFHELIKSKLKIGRASCRERV